MLLRSYQLNVVFYWHKLADCCCYSWHNSFEFRIIGYWVGCRLRAAKNGFSKTTLQKGFYKITLQKNFSRDKFLAWFVYNKIWQELLHRHNRLWDERRRRMRRMKEMCEDLCLVDCSLVRSLSLLPTTPGSKPSTNSQPPAHFHPSKP
jgi:hypothetical protein